MSQRQALDNILAKPTADEGWGRIAHDLNLKLGQVRSEVEEKQVARVERVEKAEKMEKPETPAKVEQPGR